MAVVEWCMQLLHVLLHAGCMFVLRLCSIAATVDLAARLVCEFQLVSLSFVSFEKLIGEVRKLHHERYFCTIVITVTTASKL